MRIAQSSLNFKYEELRKATNYFDPANKLGQGSYGAVFKVQSSTTKNSLNFPPQNWREIKLSFGVPYTDTKNITCSVGYSFGWKTSCCEEAIPKYKGMG